MNMDIEAPSDSLTAVTPVQDKSSPLLKVIGSGNTLAVSSNRSILVAKCKSNPNKGIEVLSSYTFTLDDIVRDIAFDGTQQFLVVSCDDKTIQFYNYENQNTEAILTINTAKKVSKLYFDGDNFIYGDKFGTMYLQKITYNNDGTINASTPTVPLGHYSTIVDILVCPNPTLKDRNVIVTADRDEKIRVSQWPEAYEILCYCLGHKDFVSTLALVGPIEQSTYPYYLLSGSGDGRLILWDYYNGSIVKDIQIDQYLDSSLWSFNFREELKLKRSTLSNLLFLPSQNILLATVEMFKAILVFKITNSSGNIELEYQNLVKTKFAPLSILHLSELNNIVIVGAQESNEVVPIEVLSLTDGKFEHVESDISSHFDNIPKVDQTTIYNLLGNMLLERVYQKSAYQLQFSEAKKQKQVE